MLGGGITVRQNKAPKLLDFQERKCKERKRYGMTLRDS